MDSFFASGAKNNYLELVKIISSLSKLFSESSAPFLHYRIMENLFCQCFGADNLSRSDTAYDARINTLGVGLKTFLCEKDSSIEKVAEFNKEFKNLKDLGVGELAFKLAKLRNERIQRANEIYGIKNALYHIIARRENELIFFETDYQKIHLDSIKNIKQTETSLIFSDGQNEYFFNFSKSVLQRKFYIPQNHNALKVDIFKNPFDLLLMLKDKLQGEITETKKAGVDFVILPLYSTRGGEKNVPKRSGLNQWRADGRDREYGEVYIPVPMAIHKLAPNFFPTKDTRFNLTTPNKDNLRVKLCQQNSKALMSDPNTALSDWILKTALGLENKEMATYERMLELNFDCVRVEKIDCQNYKIDIAPLGEYERFIDELQHI